MASTSLVIPIVEIRQSYNCLIPTVGFLILIKLLYTESVSGLLNDIFLTISYFHQIHTVFFNLYFFFIQWQSQRYKFIILIIIVYQTFTLLCYSVLKNEKKTLPCMQINHLWYHSSIQHWPIFLWMFVLQYFQNIKKMIIILQMRFTDDKIYEHKSF